MTALVRMRLAGFVRGGRAVPPLIAVLVVLGVLYGGGASPAAAAYGYSAAALFPLLAWLTKLVLDTEPDVQRRLARLSVGAGRELAAGLVAAAVPATVVCVLAMLAPLPFGGIRGPLPGTAESSLAVGASLGVLAHGLALLAGVALGALSARSVTRRTAVGVTVLVAGAMLAVVLGLSGSFAPWLAPPVMATARALGDPAAPPAGTLLLLCAWSVLWCAAALALYARLRRSRS